MDKTDLIPSAKYIFTPPPPAASKQGPDYVEFIWAYFGFALFFWLVWHHVLCPTMCKPKSRYSTTTTCLDIQYAWYFDLVAFWLWAYL